MSSDQCEREDGLLNDYENGIKVEEGLKNQVRKYEYTEEVKVEVDERVVAPDEVKAQGWGIEPGFVLAAQMRIVEDSRR